MAKVERLPSGKLKYRGELFPGYNKPKRAPKGSKKNVIDMDEDKYLRKYKKIEYDEYDPVLQDEADEELGWAVR